MDIYDWATDDYYGQRAEELRNGAEPTALEEFLVEMGGTEAL